MSSGVDINLKDMVVSSTLFGPREVQQIRDAIAADFSNYRQLRDAVQELESAQSTSPAAATKLGVCYFLLGRYRLADEMLRSADGGADGPILFGPDLQCPWPLRRCREGLSRGGQGRLRP